MKRGTIFNVGIIRFKISLIGTVKDEIARINNRKPPLAPVDLCPTDNKCASKEAAATTIATATATPAAINTDATPTADAAAAINTDATPAAADAATTRIRTYSIESTGSTDTTTPPSNHRARRGDIYALVSEEEILTIIAEIDAGRFVSNTPCAPWTKGQKHHPSAPDTFKVRRHLAVSGPQTKESIHLAIPSISEKFLRSILHELREQGIAYVLPKN